MQVLGKAALIVDMEIFSLRGLDLEWFCKMVWRPGDPEIPDLESTV